MKLTVPFLYHERHTEAVFEWKLIDKVPNEYNFEQLLQQVQQSKFKIAALPVLCDEPGNFAYDLRFTTLDFSQFDLVILSDIEFASLADIRAWITKKQIKNYVLAAGGLHSKYVDLLPNEIYRPWWAFNLINNKHWNDYQDTNRDLKPFMFEAMLGARRAHRDYVMLAFQRSGLLDKNIVNYRDRFGGNPDDPYFNQITNHFSEIILNRPYISKNLNLEWEEELDNNTCGKIPYKIYEQTYYSIVCETGGTIPQFFMSEKTAKAFWAKRVFVLFGTANFLKQLRDLGFKTFDYIIDESYDRISNPIERFDAAFEQVIWLTKQDPIEIYNRACDILEHNHNHLLSLKQQTADQMIQILEQAIPAEFIAK